MWVRFKPKSGAKVGQFWAGVNRFGDNAGKAIGMKTADGRVGFRVEYDARSGAHINVWAGKEKGPHFQFDASQSTVNRIIRQFVKEGGP
jgi:hypothetical protein